MFYVFLFLSEISPNGSYITATFNYRLLRPVPKFQARLNVISKY